MQTDNAAVYWLILATSISSVTIAILYLFQRLWGVLGQHKQCMLSELCGVVGNSGGDISSSDKSVDIPENLSAVAVGHIQRHVDS